MHRDSHFGVALEPADSRPVAGARIDDDDRRLVRIDAVVPAVLANLGDAKQRIVGRPLEVAGVQQRLVLEGEQRRQAGRSCAIMLFARSRSVSRNRTERSRKSLVLDILADPDITKT